MTSHSQRRRWPTYLAGSLVALTAIIGLAHTKAGRPLLNALRGAPGCPVDLDKTTPAAIEAQRVARLEAQRGQQRERSRPALSFELGRTRKNVVTAQMQAQGMHCESLWNGAALRCTGALASPSLPAAPRVEDIHLQFDASGTLVAVDLLRASSSSALALGWLAELDRELAVTVGPATHQQGDRSPAHLDKQLRRTELEYRYHGYVAQVSATNLGSRGVRVREQYQWLPG